VTRQETERQAGRDRTSPESDDDKD
jgi:hypothetical protein